MHMTKLTSLFLTATLSLTSSVVLVAETSTQSNNGQAGSSMDVGQIAPDARRNVAPNSVDNGNMNSGGTMLHPNGSSMNREEVAEDEIHENTICRNGRYPDMNKKIKTGNGINNDAETRTDGTTQ